MKLMEHTDFNSLDKLARQILFEEYRSYVRSSRKTINILAVEDDPLSRKLIQNILQGYEVEFCSNVFKAVDEYWRIVPDLVFLDINLGNRIYNGFDVLGTITSYDKESQIILLSGSYSEENIKIATHHGAVGFISKPFSASQLTEIVERCNNKKLLVSICS